MSRRQAARARPGKAEVERKRDERAARRALARERRNRQQGEGEHDEDRGGLNEQLRALGLRLREVPGDGNCLFRALGDQLEGHSRNHLKHRQDTAAFMIRQRADFEPFVEDDLPFEKHVANLAQPGTFAGNDAIVAFARNNQVNVVIHQQNAPLWQIRGAERPTARELHIAYRYGEHYDSVRKVNDNSAAPARLQTEMLCQNDPRRRGGPPARGEGQRPNGADRGGVEDAVQKVRNATGCPDPDFVAQVLEAEGCRIEATILAVLQMRELERLQAEEDQGNRPSPPPRPDPRDEEGSGGGGRQEVEDNNNGPRGNLVERNRPAPKAPGRQRKELQRLEKKKRQEERHRQKVLAGPPDNNQPARDPPAGQVTLVKAFAALSI